MTSNLQSETATVYQFPLRGRYAASQFADRKLASNLSPTVAAALDGNWYHAEAILDAERARKN